MEDIKVGDFVKVVEGGHGVAVIDLEYYQNCKVKAFSYKPSGAYIVLKGGKEVALHAVEKVKDLKPHPHKDIIIAWANGEEIQFFCTPTNSWQDLTNNPGWIPRIKYRIKPSKEVLIRIEELKLKIHNLTSDLNELKRSIGE